MSPREHAPFPFWIYELLLGGSSASRKSELPELVMPHGDQEWTTKDGRRLKWCDGWRSCWHSMLGEFWPSTETRNIVRYSKTHPHGFIPEKPDEPPNSRQWWSNIDDTAMGKREGQPLTDFSVEHYKFINDVFGWALNSTLEYCRHRMGWGDWAMAKRGEEFDVPFNYFFERPRSQRACKFLVNWLVRFAKARQQYHLHVAAKIKHPCYSQTKSGKNVKEIITQQKGRPRKLRMGRKRHEDLWLILIWPVAIGHRWTYRDAVRAVRLHFGDDHPTRPALKFSSAEVREKELKAFIERHHSSNPVEEGVPNVEAERRAAALKVSAADTEAIRLRCDRLQLEKLSPGRRDMIAEPRLLSLVNRFHVTG